MVSVTNFLALIMVGRWTDPAQLGAYAIASSVLALFLATQESLVTRPYAIQLHEPLGTPAERAFGSLALGVLLSLFGAVALSAAALALPAFGADPDVAEVTWALAAATPFVLTREFARRFAFSHLQIVKVLKLDIAVAVLNVAALGWLYGTGRLSAAMAVGALGLACAVATLGWLYLARADFAVGRGQIEATLNQSWRLGKWLLSGQLALQAQGYATYWLSTLLAGAALTGVYTACMSIVSFANPLLFGFYNILTPRSVRALRAGGGAGLRRQAAWDALLLAAVMASFSVFVLVFGEDVMRFLYPSPAYTGNGHILGVLAVAGLAAAVGVPASIALASAERARAVAAVMIATAVLNIILVWWFMTEWGLLGAAYAALMAEAVGSLGRWAAFLAFLRKVRA